MVRRIALEQLGVSRWSCDVIALSLESSLTKKNNSSRKKIKQKAVKSAVRRVMCVFKNNYFLSSAAHTQILEVNSRNFP